MTAWKPELVNSKSYLPLLDIKDPQWGALCLRPFDDKCFWNIDLNVKLRSSHRGFCVFFFLFPSLIFLKNPNFFFWGQRREFEGGGGCTLGNICVGVCMWFLRESITYVYAFVQMWKYLCYSSASPPAPPPSTFFFLLLRVWLRWDWFLKRGKQARALLTMSLRVNAQNNFQLKIRFSGKSEFHAYYYRINAEPHSASAQRQDFFLAATTNSLSNMVKHSVCIPR